MRLPPKQNVSLCALFFTFLTRMFFMSSTRNFFYSCAAILAGVSSINAFAAFKCGPGFYTYSVTSTHGVQGQGVRCVKFSNYAIVDGGITGAYWYGEGVWGTTKYRHIGTSFKIMKDFNGNYTSRAYATDIYGNGENAAGVFTNLNLIPISGFTKIGVPGWGEEWTLQTSGVHNTYTSTLSVVKSCGAHLDTYTVSGSNGVTAPGSVRCAMRDSYISVPAMWYGEGNWGTSHYRHLGFVQIDQNQNAYGTAADICDNASNVCGWTSTNGLNIKPLMGCFQTVKYNVSGQWNENWTGTSTFQCPR
jgi:hypothetical protein